MASVHRLLAGNETADFRLRLIRDPPRGCPFYEVLRHVVNGRQVILVKVRLGDLLHIPAGSGYEWLNKANQKHVDFVLCEALACAEIPILHVRAAVAYDVQDLADRITQAPSASSA